MSEQKEAVRKALSLQYRIFKDQLDSLHVRLSSLSSLYKGLDCLGDKENVKAKFAAEIAKIRDNQSVSEEERKAEREREASEKEKEKPKSCRRLPQVRSSQTHSIRTPSACITTTYGSKHQQVYPH